MLNLITSIIMFITILYMAFFLIIEHKKVERLKKILTQKQSLFNNLFEKIEHLSSERQYFYDRTIELEDIKGEAFLVRLRNEIIKVEVGFTKVEIVMILSGISLLLERSKNSDDAKIYIQLIDKINGFIENMEE